MKKIVLLLLLFPLFFSCNGQGNKTTETTYSQKLEYGLKGAVKEVVTYIHTVEDGKIPENTAKPFGKITMTFDKMGNVITINKMWDIKSIGKSEFLSVFSGKGKALSYKETAHLYDGEHTENSYKYIWLDDYSYNVRSEKDSSYSNIITLDKNYRLLKSVFKKEEVVESIQEIETIYKNNKIQEIASTETETTDGKKTVSYRIQVAQEYDNEGNPTVLYGYYDLNKQKVKHVLYKEYTYY
ncbi:hypothetical protein [Flavobacterium sp.]|uniref:hypothetical protein n=1 Tax=Flavobacterium sp. TaxID=239 RepID=UPI00261503F2|nr:hypothetical protein [Flavobacterium sp.]